MSESPCPCLWFSHVIIYLTLHCISLSFDLDFLRYRVSIHQPDPPFRKQDTSFHAISKLEAAPVMALISTLRFFHGQLFQTPPLPTTDLTGRTIIVTGANTGLGFECAKYLVRLNVSRLILACRNLEKGEAASKILLASKPTNTTARLNIEVWLLDMSSYASVLAFGDRCQSSLSRLDAVVENAGIAMNEYILAEDNESTITVNVISTFLLALLVLPKLRESAAQFGMMGRLVIVGSAVHIWANDKDLEVLPGQTILGKLSDRRTANMKDRYNMSKLLVILCIREFAARAESSKKPLVIISNVAPGWCKTELFRHGMSAGEAFMLRLIGRTSEQGGRTLVHGATEAARESHGAYLSECQVKSPSSFVTSKVGKQKQEELWDEVVEMLEKVRPGICEML
jgi:retinol dehydrogenase 12